MSSPNTKENREYVRRLIEVCGTSRPKEIAALLDISYSAAKNYLSGRLPDAKILLVISEQTNFSIHWLLTGKGEKFIDEELNENLSLLVNNLTEIADPDFLVELGKFLNLYNLKKRYTPTDPPKTVKLTPDKIREEKVWEEKSSDLPSNPS